MRRIALRLLSALPTLLGVLVVTFLLARVLPGDPAAYLASQPGTSPADVEALRQALGLDQPLWRQFARYLGALARGDLGTSPATGQSVAAELARRLPASAELGLAALALAFAAALPLGVAASRRPGGVLDHAVRALAVLGGALPGFVTALLLILLFYVHLGWAPEPMGRLDPFLPEPARRTGLLTFDALLAGEWVVLRSALAHLLLPALALALFAFAPLLRMTRAAMLEVLGTDFIHAARAAGLGRRQWLFSYALRNALVPVITTLGMTFSFLLGASVLVEQVFSWPGIGAFAVASITNLDHAALQGFVLLMAALFLLVNLLTDIALALIDPRVEL